MAAADVCVALLGYGTVGSAVHRLLVEGQDDIERATGHRLRVVRALVRDAAKERKYLPEASILTTDFAAIRDDESISVVAEVMGGLDPAGSYVIELLERGRSVVSANKQLVARRSGELFAAAAKGGTRLRFEASVCAAIPVIKILRESLVVTNVHRVLGIVNGTTNFILTRMEQGAEYAGALAEAQALGYAEADPSDDVSGADAAAKMAILATIAFGGRVHLSDVDYEGVERVGPREIEAAQELGMVVRLIGAATLVDGSYDVRVYPAFVDHHHPLAAVEGAFNAVTLQGDSIREITLEGPGAGGIETASAVVGDLVGVIGAAGTGFLQGDVCWRELDRLPAGQLRSPHFLRVDVMDRPGVLAHVAERLAERGVSVARLVQHLNEDDTATLHILTHEASQGATTFAVDAIRALPETLAAPPPFIVIADRGVAGLGWV
jgi:homoserine dehydrogenase